MTHLKSTNKLRRGFTIVELLVVIAIIVILMALLLPTIGSVRDAEKQAECASHLSEIGKARIHAQNLNSTNWTDKIETYFDGDTRTLHCPVDFDRGSDIASSYGMNNRADRYSDSDGRRIVMLDYNKTEAKLVVSNAADQDNWDGGEGSYAARHMDTLNVLYHDGSTSSRTADQLDPRDCDIWLASWRPYQDLTQLANCGLTLNEDSNPAPVDSTEDDPVDDGSNDDSGSNSDNEGTCEESDPQVIDDNGRGTSPGFSIEGPAWEVGDGLDGNSAGDQLHRKRNYSQPSKAVYRFNVTPGKFHIWVRWNGSGPSTGLGKAAASTETPYVIYDGDELVDTVTVNQQEPVSGSEIDGENWLQLGTGDYEFKSDIVRVEIPCTQDPSLGPFDLVYVIADVVRIDCVVAPTTNYSELCESTEPKTVDNGGQGYTSTGGFQEAPEEAAFGGSQEAAAPGGSEEKAEYKFTDLPVGEYAVWTLWQQASNHAINAPFMIYDGDKLIRTLSINQAGGYLGVDLDDDARSWSQLGKFVIQSGTLRVVISNLGASGTVTADAVRAECSYNTEEEYCDIYDPITGRSCRKEYDPEGYGATDETEEAVEDNLNWLSLHQLSDGSWNYNHHQGTGKYILGFEDSCAGRCANTGYRTTAKVASTGMALLPFLGSGYSPEGNRYEDVVAAGINYLVGIGGNTGHMVPPGSNQFQQAGYEQAIGTLALAEALGVCQGAGGGYGDVDAALLQQATLAAVRRLVQCQDTDDGVTVDPDSGSQGPGWRYECVVGADLSVTGWVVQALVAAEGAGIDVESLNPNRSTMGDTVEYLDRCQGTVVPDPSNGDYSPTYGYLQYGGPMSRATEEIGLYCRGLTGASMSAAGILQGGENVMAYGGGQITDEIYVNYYSHHFMHKLGGPNWGDWNEKVQDYFLGTIGEEGHEEGSWFLDSGEFAGDGGRLMSTALGALCLEVYYRNLNSTQ